MLPAPQQGRAADRGHGALAIEFEKQLIAHHRAARGKAERIESRMGADRRCQGRNMQRVTAFSDHFDMVNMSAVADEQFEHGVDLIIAARRTFMALD